MASSIESATKTIGDTKMTVAGLMQETEQFRLLSERLQLEVGTGESGIRETVIAIRSVEGEMASAEMGRRGSENTGSELIKKKLELQERHIQIKKELEKITTEVETLERLATDWRHEEAILTTRLTDLRERAAVLREQKANQQTSIDDMERAIASAKRKISLLDEEMDYFTGNDDEVELTSEEIVERIEKTVSEKNDFRICNCSK